MKLANINEALADFRRGRAVIFVRGNHEPREAYLALAAEKATAESIGLLLAQGAGSVGLALTPERVESLGMLATTQVAGTALEQSGNGAEELMSDPIATDGTAAAIRALADPTTRPEDVAIPRRFVPLRATRGGVVACAAPVEAAVDLARLGGLNAVGVFCRIATPSGNGTAESHFEGLASRHDLKVVSIPALIEHRRQAANAKLVALPVPVRLPTRHGTFKAQVYEDPLSGGQHMAMIMGDIDDGQPVLTRMHSECLTGDVLGSLRCDCGPQLEQALGQIKEAGRGVLLYLRQEGRGIGLFNKLRTYALQENGRDTVEANEDLGFPADMRDYSIASQMLAALKVNEVRLMTNNPKKIEGLERHGMRVAERVPVLISASTENRHYLSTKRKKLGHMLLDDDSGQ